MPSALIYIAAIQGGMSFTHVPTAENFDMCIIVIILDYYFT